MRALFALALTAVVVACSGEGSLGPKTGEWESCSLADGRVSFSMPNHPNQKSTESGSGEDLVTEEIASCDYYAEGLGLCHFRASVLSGPTLARDFGTTASERRNWAKFLIVEMLSDEEGREIAEEGDWSFGEETGYWVRVALPVKPPTRTFPVFNWIRVSASGDVAVIQQFIGSQAAFVNSMLEPKQSELRERFFASFDGK
jgi:hypothetical protein